MALRVNLWGELLGALDYDQATGQSHFQFNPEFDLAVRNVAPLLMPFPSAANKVYGPFHVHQHPVFEGLPPMLADALPDHFGNNVLRSWLQWTDQQSELTVEQRLCYVGSRGMGALEFVPELLPEQATNSELELQQLAALSNRIGAAEIEPAKLSREVLNHLFLVGTSAGGARPKALVSINPNTRKIVQTSGHLPDFTPAVLKFDRLDNSNPEQSADLGKIEYIYHRMATDCGITMSQCGLIKHEPMRHFATARFDRTAMGEKLHMQTLAAIAGLDPRQLYDYNTIFAVLLKLHLPYSSLEEYFKRMVFNLLSANDDCHTKNTAFLMDRAGNWSLSPAYDLTFPFDYLNVLKRPHPVSINGKTTNIELADVLAVAKQFGIKRPTEMIERVQAALQRWPEHAARYKLREDAARIIPTHFRQLLD